MCTFVFIFSKRYFHIHQNCFKYISSCFLMSRCLIGYLFHTRRYSGLCTHFYSGEGSETEKKIKKCVLNTTWKFESSESKASRWMDGWKALGGMLIRGPKVLLSTRGQRGRQSSKVEMMALWCFWLGEKGSHLHLWLSRALGEPGNLMRWTLCQIYVMREATRACNSENLVLEIVGHLNCAENNPGDFSCATLVA